MEKNTPSKSSLKKIPDDEIEILSFTSEYKTLKKDLMEMQKNSNKDDVDILSLTTNYKNLKKDIDEYQKKENKTEIELVSLTTEYKNLKKELEEYKKKYEEEKELNKEEKLKLIEESKIKEKNNNKKIIKTIIKIVIILLIIYVLFFQIFGITKIDNNSMHPTISKGDLVFFVRHSKDYKVGDIVTFKKDGKRYILRIIGIENQTIYINNEDKLVNKNNIDQSLYEDIIPKNSEIKYPYDIQKNKVFVVGDYRLETDDSRMFGEIDINMIDGKVIN